MSHRTGGMGTFEIRFVAELGGEQGFGDENFGAVGAVEAQLAVGLTFDGVPM